ncbi:MAG: ATPase [Thermoprotei archaeon]|nr:MAG: ATPase [Thermoprotei archaeon]
MLEIAVASGKGGVGKSTIASSIAIVLARKGVDLVVVDADADAPNLHLIFGIEEWHIEEPYGEAMVAEIIQEKCTRCGRCMEECPYGAIDLVNGQYVINKILCEGCLTCTLVCPVKGAIVRHKLVSGYIRETPTQYGFPLISARLEPGRPNTGKIVSEEKERARAKAKQDSVIVVDSAAGIGCQVVSSLAGANMSILVVEPTPASFSDLKRVYVLTRHFMQPAALVINKYDINEDFLPQIKSFASDNNLEILGMIPYDENLPISMAHMKPMIEMFPDSPASKELVKIAEKVYDIVVNWRKWYIEHRPKQPMPYKPQIIRPEDFKQQ